MAWIFLLKLLLLGACLLTRATSASPFSSATSNAVLYGNSNGVFGEAEFFNATSLRFVICHSNTTVPPINLTTIANTLEFVALFNSSSFGNGTVAARQAVNVTDLPDFALYTDGCAYGSWSSNASFNSVTRLNLTTQLWVRNRYTGLVLSQLHVGARDRVRNASVANKPPDTDRYPRNYSINDDYEKPKQLRITFNLSFVDAQSHFCQDVADLISNTSVPPVPRSRIVCSSSVDAGAVVVVVNITQVCTRDSLCTTETSARHEQAEDIVARVKSQINDTHSALNRSFAHGVLAVCNDSGFQECEKHRDVPQLAFPPRPQHIQILVSSVNGSLTFTPPVVSLYSYDVTTWVWMDPMNPHTMTFVDDFGDPNNYLCNIPDASSQLSSGYDCATNPSSYARKAPYNYTTTWTPLWWLPDPFNYTYVDSLNPGNMTGLIRYLGLNPNYPKGVPTVEVSVGNEQNAIAYFPAHVSVYIGQSVKWKWASTTVRHTVTGGAPPNNTLDWCSLTDGVDETTDSCFASEDSFVAEHEYTHEFAAVGEYPYFCGVHDGAMVGSVSVLDRNANPLPTTAPPTSIPLDQETHLIVGMGQSNMQGTGVYDPLIDNITDSNILQYGSCGNDTGKLVLAVEPLQHLGTPCPVPLPGTP
jgi:plastocyanin